MVWLGLGLGSGILVGFVIDSVVVMELLLFVI